MRSLVVALWPVLLLLLLPAAAVCQISVDGVLSLTPVEENSCLVAQLEVVPGDPVVSIRWYNNDGTQPFDRLLLMEGQPGVAPDVSQTGLVLADVSGPGLAWGEIQLDPPISSATGVINAVFQLPAYVERTGEGDGGGSGIGYLAGTGVGFISRDGFEWVRVNPQIRLAVELVVGAGKMAEVASLGDLVGTVEDGWWKHGVPQGESSSAAEEAAADRGLGAALAAQPLVVAPNPFNPRTEVSFYLATQGRARVDVFDVRGRLVRVLVDSILAAGAHQRVWDGRDEQARSVASGVYFVRLEGPDAPEVRRAVLVR